MKVPEDSLDQIFELAKVLFSENVAECHGDIEKIRRLAKSSIKHAVIFLDEYDEVFGKLK